MDTTLVQPAEPADQLLGKITDRIQTARGDVQLALLDDIYTAPNPFAAIPSVLSFSDHVRDDNDGMFSPTAGIEVLAELIAVDLLKKAQPETPKETLKLAENSREFSDQYARALFRSTRSAEAGLLHKHTAAVLLEHALVQLADLALENEGNPKFNINALVDDYGAIRTQCKKLTMEEPVPTFIQHRETRKNGVRITNPNHIYFGDEVVYWAAHSGIVGGILESLDEVPPQELASNRYFEFFEGGLSRLASLPGKTGYKEANIKEELEYLVSQHAERIGGLIPQIRKTHQALYVAFTQAVQKYYKNANDEARNEVAAAFVPLIDLTKRHSRILDIDGERFMQEAQRTLQFYGIEFSSAQP